MLVLLALFTEAFVKCIKLLISFCSWDIQTFMGILIELPLLVRIYIVEWLIVYKSLSVEIFIILLYV